ncbi:MAG: hypothetical protein J6A15_01350 [Clostridia bacterium]|nr:hypothetical protein [Clostridia bacterium]
MARLATGPPSVNKLHSGIENIPKKTKNLGELFNEAKKNQPFKKTRRRSKNARKILYDYRKSGVSGLYKMRDTGYTQKFCFRYVFFKENNKQSSVQRKTLRELYDAIIEKQLPLDIIDGKTFCTFIDANCNDDDYKYLIGKIWG